MALSKTQREIQLEAMLASPLFQEMMAGVQERTVSAWQGAKTVEEREHQHGVICALHSMEKWFKDQLAVEKAKRLVQDA